jgi:hypothetical protein
VRLEWLDRAIELPGRSAAAVGVILDGHRFTPGQLPGLESDDQLTLTRRLLREGIVVPA